MGICDTPQVINAPSRQPMTDPAAAINAPCQRKIALISLRLAHRPQNGDLFNLREHGHRKDIENSEAGQQNNE